METDSRQRCSLCVTWKQKEINACVLILVLSVIILLVYKMAAAKDILLSESSSSVSSLESQNKTNTSRPLDIVEVPPSGHTKHTGTLIFIHGAGDTGPGVKLWIENTLGEDFTFPELKIVYPTAPLIPYSPAGGMEETVWFDFPIGIKEHAPEDIAGIDTSRTLLQNLIDKEIENGIRPHRILLGGVSQGGIMTLHTGLQYKHNLAGLLILSSYLPENSALYPKIKGLVQSDKRLADIPLYFAHGESDYLIKCKWGEATHERLKDLELKASFRSYPALGHSFLEEELIDLRDWIISIM